MDPGWLILCFFLIIEVLLVTLLIFPMPSNTVRGVVLDGIRKVWKMYPNIRTASAVIMFLNIWYFWSAMQFIYSDAAYNTENKEVRLKLFREERNAYLTGFGIFNFLVLYRLLDLHTQLHDAREAQKREQTVKKDS
eukprot:TRINITY_DN598_c0_g1_i1.p1 TRINITY_DN598_c0_g1~~TRINITY_DN598_c0_g1_i1.p1  ORF type:complete len:158 (+),score=42.54 TRINITY_DN598_c0_g1_i1:68-475(+)